jgi:hypothetical protein
MRVGWRARAGFGLVLAGAAAAAAVHFLTSGPNTLMGPPGNGFRLEYPSSWQPMTPQQLAGLSGHPLAALHLEGGVGTVVIKREVRTELASERRLGKQVRDDFSERLADYRLLSAGLVKTGAGEIFVYAYRPPNARAVRTVALVPAGGHSYVLESVAATRDAVEQIAAMIRSFRPS